MRRRPIVRFLCLFGFLYGLLILPWPGWNALYGRYFRALGTAVFGEDAGRGIVRFDAARGAPPTIDTFITLADRGRTGPNGQAPARILELDARSVGWVPTALVIALTVSSPIPWRRRAWALPWGLLLVHLFILMSVGCFIWDESANLGLVVLTPFWKTVADGLAESLVNQLGASFVAPALIWLGVTFRARDLNSIPGSDSTVFNP